MLPVQYSGSNSWVDPGSNWWVNSIARFAGGEINGNGGSGNPTTAVADDDLSDSISSVVSDYEEEGETGEAHTESTSESSPMEDVYDGVRAGDDSALESSDAVIASAASQIQIIEAAMRQHQSTGLGKFADDESYTSDDSSNTALTGDMLQDPSLAFSATTGGQDRSGIYALLA